jgi:polysaccharide export outer membrane protein
VDDYIALAGGFSPRANQDDIYIIQANGSVTPLTESLFGFGLSRYKLQQGDTIVVPVKTNYTDRLSLLTQLTQVIYQSLVSIAALDRITE